MNTLVQLDSDITLLSKACDNCGEQSELHHASTWGVSGSLLGCNTYYLCLSCQSHKKDRSERSTLSPCREKHVQLIDKK